MVSCSLISLQPIIIHTLPFGDVYPLALQYFVGAHLRATHHRATHEYTHMYTARLVVVNTAWAGCMTRATFVYRTLRRTLQPSHALPLQHCCTIAFRTVYVGVVMLFSCRFYLPLLPRTTLNTFCLCAHAFAGAEPLAQIALPPTPHHHLSSAPCHCLPQPQPSHLALA